MWRIRPSAALLACLSAAAAPGPFSSAGLQGWVEQTFKDVPRVHYRLTRKGGVQVLEAECRAGASGWLWRETVDLRRTPVLAWRWKVGELPGGTSEREKAGDDFATRVYVVRDGGWAPWRTRSLVYVWARHEPAGTDWPSAYTAQAHMVALRSGAAQAGRWLEERRDLRADFRRYFGFDARTADGVALMTDCGGGEAQAWYGDIRLEPAAPSRALPQGGAREALAKANWITSCAAISDTSTQITSPSCQKTAVRPFLRW